MRILISGASGYLGSRLCKELRRDHYIIALTRNPDKFNHFNEKIADEIIILKSFDHNFLEKVIDSKPEIFIHLISLDSSASNSNPLSSFDVNVGNTFKLLNHLKDSKTLKKFIYFSTIHVYNSSLKEIDELTKPKPNNFYSLTHFLSEEIINYFNKEANFKCINLRLSNSYGEPVFENEKFKGIVQALEIAEGKTIEIIEENRKLKELIVQHLPKKFYFQSTDDVNEVHDNMVENNMSCALIQNPDRPADIIDLSDFLHLMGQSPNSDYPSN